MRFEGNVDLDSACDWHPFSEAVSQKFLDPPVLFEDLLSGLLNFLFNVLIKLSLDVFFFESFEDDSPHHEGIFTEI